MFRNVNFTEQNLLRKVGYEFRFLLNQSGHVKLLSAIGGDHDISCYCVQ